MSAKIHTGMTRGPEIGAYAGKPIPAWIDTQQGRHRYVGVTGPRVNLNTLTPGQLVIAPGLLYERETR